MNTLNEGAVARQDIFDGARVIVTGGAGFIGSHLVDELLKLPQVSEVAVIDNFVNGRMENLEQAAIDPRLSIFEGDVRDGALLEQTISAQDVVFHLACLGVRHSIHSPMENHEVNAEGTLRLLQTSRDAGVRRFIHVSSSEVFGTAQYVPMSEDHPTLPETVYGGSKLAGEAYARAYFRTYGMPVVVARPFNTYGPRSHYEGDSGEIIPRSIVKALAGQPPVIFGDGLQTRDFMHVSDTVKGLVALAQCDAAVGRTVNFGTGREVTMREVCELISVAVGGGMKPRFLPSRPGDVGRLCVDSTLFQELLGFAPSTALEGGITALVEWFRNTPLDAQTMSQSIADTNWEPAGVAQ